MPSALPDVDVRGRAEDPIAQLLLEPGHQRQRDDERHHADRHAERRDERDDRDERLLALGEQIAERDVQLEGDMFITAKLQRRDCSAALLAFPS